MNTWKLEGALQDLSTLSHILQAEISSKRIVYPLEDLQEIERECVALIEKMLELSKSRSIATQAHDDATTGP